MSKKHFEEFARQIKGMRGQVPEDARALIAETVADVAQADNARFDRERFRRACDLCGAAA